jgi:aspartate-semialdehyde dehydrogenase
MGLVIAVVGSTGLVGQKMLRVLEERKVPCEKVIAVASERSVGRQLKFGHGHLTVVGVEEALAMKPNVALFSAGSALSKHWAKSFTAQGCFVIDNSSAWRMDPDVPLVVPEVNGDSLKAESKLIANPNCSTIQLVLAMAPLHRAFGLQRMVISTYQAVTGTGQAAVHQMNDERAGKEAQMVYPYPIDMNCLPHGGDFQDNGYTTEEMKLVHESRKIMDAPNLKVTATVVRVPILGGHSESVNARFEKPFDLPQVRELLKNQPGIILEDNPAKNQYPMPLFAGDKDHVFVGRLRLDESEENSLNLWIVSDNLRKGAATNAVQILEQLLERGFVQA